MIRLRRLPPTGLLHRKRYEIEFPSASGTGSPTRKVTTTPVTAIDQVVGVGDAWTLVHAADDAWDGESGQWVTLRADE
jgi:hypothetical protein